MAARALSALALALLLDPAHALPAPLHEAHDGAEPLVPPQRAHDQTNTKRASSAPTKNAKSGRSKAKHIAMIKKHMAMIEKHKHALKSGVGAKQFDDLDLPDVDLPDLPDVDWQSLMPTVPDLPSLPGLGPMPTSVDGFTDLFTCVYRAHAAPCPYT